MYPVTSTIGDLFKTTSVQKLSVAVSPVTGSSFNLTEANILSGGLSINRYVANGDSIQIGTCVASELTMRLENFSGQLDSYVFEGAELYVRVGVENGNSTSWIPLGYFTVDNTPRNLAIIEITALDRMVQFDKPVSGYALNLPCTVADLVALCCADCNVTLGTTLSSLPNALHIVNSVGEMENMTYRTILQWCCQLMGVCGYIDWQGQLKLEWFADAKYNSVNTRIVINPSDRYTSDLFENAITITGVIVKGAETQVIYGTDQYAFLIEGNPLFSDDEAETIATNLSSLVGFTYHPFSASVLPMPYIFPLDMLTFIYKGSSYTVAVTETTFTASSPTQMKGTGESSQSKSYARLNPLTARERAIYVNMKEEMNATLNKAVNNAIEFNDIISNALGLYVTDVPDGSGGTIRYLHDAPDLEDSTYIVTHTAEGFAWTTSGWNNGSPVWSYGVTSSGFAMFKRLSAEGIDVTNASTPYRSEITPEHFNIYYMNELLITIDAVKRAIQTPRIIIPYSTTSDNYIKIGSLYILPADGGADMIVIGE